MKERIEQILLNSKREYRGKTKGLSDDILSSYFLDSYHISGHMSARIIDEYVMKFKTTSVKGLEGCVDVLQNLDESDVKMVDGPDYNPCHDIHVSMAADSYIKMLRYKASRTLTEIANTKDDLKGIVYIDRLFRKSDSWFRDLISEVQSIDANAIFLSKLYKQQMKLADDRGVVDGTPIYGIARNGNGISTIRKAKDVYDSLCALKLDYGTLNNIEHSMGQVKDIRDRYNQRRKNLKQYFKDCEKSVFDALDGIAPDISGYDTFLEARNVFFSNNKKLCDITAVYNVLGKQSPKLSKKIEQQNRSRKIVDKYDGLNSKLDSGLKYMKTQHGMLDSMKVNMFSVKKKIKQLKNLRINLEQIKSDAYV